MANKVKPRICRTNEISIPIDTEECVLWLNPVQSVDDIKNPTRDYAWITPDNTVYVFNGHKIVPIFSTNDSHIKWGHVDGDIKDQKDLYKILLKTVNGVKQNGTELPKDLEQKVNVSVPIMHIKVNNTELEPNEYTVNIDLTTYAKTSDIPTKLSQLSNDTGYVTPETIDVPIQTITVNGNLLTPDEHKNVSIEVPTKTSQLTNDSGYITNASKIYKGTTENGYEGTGWVDGDLYVQYVENEESTDFSETVTKTGRKWIDGKPIYKKVIKQTNVGLNNSMSISHGISNIKEIVKVEGIFFDGGNWNPLPQPSADGSKIVGLRVDNSVIKIVGNDSYSQRTDRYLTVIIYFTATTD